MSNVIFTGHESGKVALFNVKSGEELHNNERAHGEAVTDLQFSKDRTYCITSSKDKSARVSNVLLFYVRITADEFFQIHDAKTLQVLKTFPTETPLNSAALMPNRPYVSMISPLQQITSARLTKRRSIGTFGRWTRGNECHYDCSASR